jgi:hypothetical protein
VCPSQLAARRVKGEPGEIVRLISGLAAKKARTKYGCSKTLRILAERRPDLLYPRFAFFAKLIESDNTFLKWDAIRIVASLAAVDTEGKFERIFRKYFRPIAGPVMITAAHSIAGGGRIALARPLLSDRIATELLKVEGASYATAECLNVALGHAIGSVDRFFGQLRRKKRVLDFVRRQLANSRPATRKKAERFLRRWDAGGVRTVGTADN